MGGDMVVRMAIKTTLNLDDQEYREAQSLAAAHGVPVGDWVSRALRDARLRSWHRRDRAAEASTIPDSLSAAEEGERESLR
jgi:hypothetical protein